MRRFYDRAEAGRLLAGALEQYQDRAVVYALPRGGVVAGAEVAQHLRAPLDLLLPRRIGHPLDPELAVCALAESGHLACSPQELAQLDAEWLEEAVKREQAEARRRRQEYLAGRPPVPAEGKTAIITDDGVATGLTMIAAILDARELHPARTVAAIPVLPAEAATLLSKYADEVVALDVPEAYEGAVGAYYEHFEQLDDADVVRLLDAGRPKRDGSWQEPLAP